MLDFISLLLLTAPPGDPVSNPIAIDSVLDFARKGGVMMIPIGICSLLALAVVVERSIVLRRRTVVPARFEEGFEDTMQGDPRRREAGLEYCRTHPSPAARVVASGLEKLPYGREVVEQHLTAAGEEEVFQLRKRLRVLVVVTAVAPLLGLTGTIFGMIKAFQTVALSGEALGKAELLASGIHEAMISTAAGLIVAMPTMVLYHWLLSRVELRTRELDRIAVEFVERYVLEPSVAAGRDPEPRRAAHDGSGEPPEPFPDPIAAGVQGEG